MFGPPRVYQRPGRLSQAHHDRLFPLAMIRHFQLRCLYVYGFSTYGTGGSGGLQGDKILVGRFPVERGVGAFIVVEELIAGQGGLDRVDAQGAVVASPELDAGTAVGTFHTAVVLGTLRRQHMQRERQGLEELGQEALCVAGGGACKKFCV